jgi:hypothetical protein
VPPRLSVHRKAKYQHERALESLINPRRQRSPELGGISLIAGDCDTDLDVLSTVRDFAQSRRPCACYLTREGAAGAPAENEAPKAMAMSASGRGQPIESRCEPEGLYQSIPRSAGVVIRIRLCAPSGFRAPVLMEREGTNDANAVRMWIEGDAAARAGPPLGCFNIEGEDRHVYDVALNIERLSLETCVNTIVELAESRRLPDHAAMRSAVADKLIEVRIRSALAGHTSRSMAPLGVRCRSPTTKVTLNGVSCSGGLRGPGEEIAHAVSGALPIDNRIVSVPSRGRPWPSAVRQQSSIELYNDL